jgi:hypothetical protein
MAVRVVAHWYCGGCEVEGRDPGAEPRCWNCGDAVTVTARPSMDWAERSLVGD